jgi:very-short-patch-repair endonuclease
MAKQIEFDIADKIEKAAYDIRIVRNDEEPYTLYCLTDLGKVFGISNIRMSFWKKDKCLLIKTQTSGGEQSCAYITYLQLQKLLTKSRKKSVHEFARTIGIDVHAQLFACIEADTFLCICTSFKGEIFLDQYPVDRYFIDMYMPKYKIAIECDENHRDKEADKNRETDIIRKLDCKFIRFNPHEKDFNIFTVINQIFREIISSA